MKLTRASLIAIAVCVFALGLVFSGRLGIANIWTNRGCNEVQASAPCGKCGDGKCVRQCGENERTCPADCAPSTSAATACGKCGDGKCVPQCGENERTCPADCRSTSTTAKPTEGRGPTQ